MAKARDDYIYMGLGHAVRWCPNSGKWVMTYADPENISAQVVGPIDTAENGRRGYAAISQHFGLLHSRKMPLSWIVRATPEQLRAHVETPVSQAA